MDTTTDKGLLPNPNNFVPFVGGISFIAGVVFIILISVILFHHLSNK